MAAPSKKRDTGSEMINLEQENEGDDDNSGMYNEGLDSDGSDTDESVYGKVQVDFVARTAEDMDSHGIQNLLKQLLLKANVNISDITAHIIAHNYIGSVIKQADFVEEELDDEDDEQESVLGIITVINLTHNKGQDFVKQLKSMLRSHCQNCAPSLVGKLEAILDDDKRHVGFIINERIINIPPQISPPSFAALCREMDSAKSKKMKYDFGYYILISKTYRMSTDRQTKNKKKKNKNGSKEVHTFVNAEEELFFKEAELTFEFSVKSERDTGIDGQWDMDSDELEPMRTVSVISADKLPVIMARMTELYSLTTAEAAR
jgi:protein BCP1